MKNLFLEASIEDSFIYQRFNASNSLIQRIVKYIKTSVVLDKSYYEEQYLQMTKVPISPLSAHVMEALDNGDLELLFSRETKVGISIPFIIRKNEKGKIVATIFIASFSLLDENDNLNIQTKQLYALLESAYIALRLQKYPANVQRDASLMKICCLVYTEMMMRILNKDYAITTDRVLYDKVWYALSRFFLTNLWEYPNKELIHNYASTDLKYIENLDLDLLKQGYEDSQIKDVSDLMDFIRNLSPRMKDLNIRYFIERFINTYHGSSIMCVDYLPYVFFVIVNILLGSFLISQQALNDIIKNTKNINKFYSELSKFM